MPVDVDSIWEECSERGKTKPWFVISVIGDSKSIVPSTWEKSTFQNSLIDTAKGANECWIIHKGGKSKLSQTVQKAVENYWEINGKNISEKRDQYARRRIKHVDLWKNVRKANIQLFSIQPMENGEDVKDSDNVHHTFRIPEEDYIQTHANLLKKIGEERVKIMRLHKDLTIQIPVIVLVAEGDVKTIKHVDRILRENIPIVIIKGSGKASDVISEFLEHGMKILKSKVPLLLGTHTNKADQEKVKALMRSIKKRQHLITVYDITDPHRRSLSDTASDAILSSWAVQGARKPERQTDTSTKSSDLFPLPNLDQIANFVDDTPRMPYIQIFNEDNMMETLRPPGISIVTSGIENKPNQHISGSSSIGTPRPLATNITCSLSASKTTDSGKTWINPSSFPLYFFIAYQLIQTHFSENSEERKDNFRMLLVKAIEADKLDYVAVLLNEHDVELQTSSLPHLYNETVKCKLCQSHINCQHLYSIIKKKKASERLFDFDPDNCLQASRDLCAEFLHYPRSPNKREGKKATYHDLLIWSLFAHRPQLATLFWNACEDQLLTALLAYGVLNRMASIAKETADQSVYKDLKAHARAFEKKSLNLQSELYKEYPKDAIEIMTTDFNVWDINISPLSCAYNNDMYEFIADPCSQRCLNKIWYNELGTNISVALKMGFKCRSISGKSAILRLMSAPFTKFVVNYLVFFLGILLYSAFLLTNIRTIDEIGGFEIFVYVWMVSDMVEEYLVPMIHRKQQRDDLQTSSSWSNRWYRFGRYINNFWNILDTVSYLLTVLAIALRFSEVTLLWARRVYSFSLFLMFMRFLHVVLIYRKVGVYVILIKEMMRDLARFIIILIVFMLAVGVMYHANKYPNHQNMWPSDIEKWRIWQIIYLPYWQIYGEVLLDGVTGTKSMNSSCTYVDRENELESNINRCEESDDWIVFVIAGFYMLLSNLLLVNLVIALFSARFEKVRANSEKIWRYIRYSYIMDYKIRVPAVINIVLRPIMMIYWCICDMCRCCTNRVHTEAERDSENEDQDIDLNHIRTLQTLCSVRC